MLGLIGDQVFVGDAARKIVAGRVPHHHVVLNAFELVGQRSKKWNEVGVDEDRFVLGVIDDVDDLVSKQSDVDGVTDPTGVRRCPIELVVTLVVPGEGSHGIARIDAKSIES